MTMEASFADRVRINTRAFGCCVVLPSLSPGLSETEATQRIARGLEMLSGRLPLLGGLTVIGGETFAAFCRMLKATRLSVDGEFLHGVPASRIEVRPLVWNVLRLQVRRFRRAGLALETYLLVSFAR